MALGVAGNRELKWEELRRSLRRWQNSSMSIGQRLRTPALSCVVAALALNGCHSASDPTPENFTKGIAKYLVDHPDCLYKTALRFPYETSDPTEIKQLDSLVANKLLERGTEPAIHITRYSISDYGQKSAPRFCYGFRHVTGIETYTPPAKGADGFNESRVTYHYTLEDTPVWAKSAGVEAVYPELAKALAGPGSATITMAQTGVGWQVPD